MKQTQILLQIVKLRKRQKINFIEFHFGECNLVGILFRRGGGR